MRPGMVLYNLASRKILYQKLPMDAYGLGGLENPDFPIKIRIFHSSACGVYFRDLLV